MLDGSLLQGREGEGRERINVHVDGTIVHVLLGFQGNRDHNESCSNRPAKWNRGMERRKTKERREEGKEGQRNPMLGQRSLEALTLVCWDRAPPLRVLRS